MEEDKTKSKKQKVAQTERVLLIDAHALIHRAYHAMPNLVSREGIPTGALFGLTNMLYHMLLDLKPERLISCYDLPKETFRHIAFAGYKQNRKASDSALVEQIISSREVFVAFGIDMLDYEGYEADDVIGTLVIKLQKENESKKPEDKKQIIIVSGDMDTMQMVAGDEVVVYTAKKDTDKGFFYNDEEVFKKYNIHPRQIADYKGLRGDTSDNIPGIKGIGEKTAAILMAKFDSLDNLYKEVDAAEDNGKTFKDFGVTERIFGLLKSGKDDAIFSRTLATINCEVPVEIPEFAIYNFNDHRSAVVELCEKYNFISIKRKIESQGLPRKVLEKTESLGDSNTKTFIKKNKDTDNLFSDFENVVEANIWDENTLEKCKVAIWMLRSEETNASQERIIYLTKKENADEALAYLEEELKKENLFELYLDMEVPVIEILKNMRETGVRVSRDALKEMLNKYNIEKDILIKEIHVLAGEEFNLSSPKQMGEIIYTKLKIGTKIKKTKGGALSTRADILESLKGEHEIIGKILEYREKEKMTSTYLEPLLIHSEKDSKIHSTFLQSGSTTGRFSSVNPNMQNIPVKGDEGKAIRNCFVASEDKLLLAADYSQIELRVAGMLSTDPYLKHIFQNNLDVHTIVAKQMFGVEEKDVTKDMRRAAKAMNFGIIYGMGVSAIKSTLEVERSEAQRFYDTYTSTMYVLMKFLKDTVERAKDIGYTETLYGRRRNVQELFSSLTFIKAQGERIAMNAPIQGTDADIVKWAMVDFDKKIKENKWEEKVKLILQIHDEILYEIDEDLKDAVGKSLKEIMENVMQGHKPKMKYENIPLIANVKTGKSWGEM